MRRSPNLAVLVLAAMLSGSSVASAVLDRGIQRGLELARPAGPLAIGALAEATHGDSLEARALDFLTRRGHILGIPGLASADKECQRAARRITTEIRGYCHILTWLGSRFANRRV